MFCTNCGTQIGDGASFCTQCGTPCGAPAGAQASAPLSQQQVWNAQVQAQPSVSSAASNGQEQPRVQVTIYDLLRKSIGAAYAMAIVCSGLIAWGYFDQAEPFLTFLDTRNANGDEPVFFWVSMVIADLVWVEFAGAAMQSLRKGMSAEELGRVGWPSSEP